MDWGSPDGKTRGWWVSLTVQSFFGEIKVVTVTGGGEGYSLRAAEEHAQILALSELRRMDPSDLSVQQLAIRADALAALVVRVEGVDSDG